MEACPQFTFYAGHSNLSGPSHERASTFRGLPLPQCSVKLAGSVKFPLLCLFLHCLNISSHLPPTPSHLEGASYVRWQSCLRRTQRRFQAHGRGQRKVQCGFPLHVRFKRSQMGFVCPLVAIGVNYHSHLQGRKWGQAPN